MIKPEEEIQKLIAEARAGRYIGPPTELRYYEKKLEFLGKWIVGNVVEKINQIRATEGGYGWHAFHIGCRPFEEEWKIETGETILYA